MPPDPPGVARRRVLTPALPHYMGLIRAWMASALFTTFLRAWYTASGYTMQLSLY